MRGLLGGYNHTVLGKTLLLHTRGNQANEARILGIN